jgi:hypothetical protein
MPRNANRLIWPRPSVYCGPEVPPDPPAYSGHGPEVSYQSPLPPSPNRTLESGWLVGGGVALEVNTRGGPGINEEQRQLYGRGRYEFEGTVQRLKTGHRARTTGTASFSYGETPSRRTTVRVEAAVMPAWSGGFGLFIRQVSGRDDYNILFLDGSPPVLSD